MQHSAAACPTPSSGHSSRKWHSAQPAFLGLINDIFTKPRILLLENPGHTSLTSKYIPLPYFILVSPTPMRLFSPCQRWAILNSGVGKGFHSYQLLTRHHNCARKWAQHAVNQRTSSCLSLIEPSLLDGAGMMLPQLTKTCHLMHKQARALLIP